MENVKMRWVSQICSQVPNASRVGPDPVHYLAIEGARQMSAAGSQQGQYVAAAQEANSDASLDFIERPTQQTGRNPLWEKTAMRSRPSIPTLEGQRDEPGLPAPGWLQ